MNQNDFDFVLTIVDKHLNDFSNSVKCGDFERAEILVISLACDLTYLRRVKKGVIEREKDVEKSK